MDPTEAEIQERIDMLAAGYSCPVVALRFGRSPGTIYNFQTRYKDRILARKEELTGEVQAIAAVRWINDVVKSTEVREALAEDTIERRADPDLPARDVSKYTRDIDQLIHRTHEVHGLLPQRIQAEVEHSGTATYEIVGLDGVQKDWAQSASYEPASAPDPEPASPEPTPIPDADLERLLGKEGAQAERERRKAERAAKFEAEREAERQAERAAAEAEKPKRKGAPVLRTLT